MSPPPQIVRTIFTWFQVTRAWWLRYSFVLAIHCFYVSWKTNSRRWDLRGNGIFNERRFILNILTVILTWAIFQCHGFLKVGCFDTKDVCSLVLDQVGWWNWVTIGVAARCISGMFSTTAIRKFTTRSLFLRFVSPRPLRPEHVWLHLEIKVQKKMWNLWTKEDLSPNLCKDL